MLQRILLSEVWLFPAHAGVILRQSIVSRMLQAFPRTRGGDPGRDDALVNNILFSPHTRG